MCSASVWVELIWKFCFHCRWRNSPNIILWALFDQIYGVCRCSGYSFMIFANCGKPRLRIDIIISILKVWTRSNIFLLTSRVYSLSYIMYSHFYQSIWLFSEEADGAGGRDPGRPRVPRLAADRRQNHCVCAYPLSQPHRVHGGTVIIPTEYMEVQYMEVKCTEYMEVQELYVKIIKNTHNWEQLK